MTKILNLPTKFQILSKINEGTNPTFWIKKSEIKLQFKNQLDKKVYINYYVYMLTNLIRQTSFIRYTFSKRGLYSFGQK